MKKSISFFCVLFLIPLFVLSCVPAFAAEPDGQITVRARVEEVVSDEMASTSYSGGEITTRVLTLRVRVLEGAFEGQTALIRQVFDEISLPSAYPAKAGGPSFCHAGTG